METMEISYDKVPDFVRVINRFLEQKFYPKIVQLLFWEEDNHVQPITITMDELGKDYNRSFSIYFEDDDFTTELFHHPVSRWLYVNIDWTDFLDEPDYRKCVKRIIKNILKLTDVIKVQHLYDNSTETFVIYERDGNIQGIDDFGEGYS